MKKLILIFSMLIILTPSFGFELLESRPSIVSTNKHENPWESYDQWQCFSLNQITFECATYDRDTLVPSIKAKNDKGIIFFDVHVEDELHCEDTLIQWRDLVHGGSKICLLAAYMPDVDMGVDEATKKPNSLWYIDQIKSRNGYWKLKDFSNDEESFNNIH
ncbi:MAG: hypothetical protein KA715_03340 [Xanthomonadaceae bacterium]|nr:hypothetical protein [Xanthomonadaceae bacterium]